MTADDALATWQAAETFRARGQLQEAGAAYTRMAALADWLAPARLRLAQLALAQGDLREGVAQALLARDADESDPVVLEAVLELLCQVGELEAALAEGNRVPIETPALAGSINLVGARIDDITLTKYRQTIKKDSPAVRLFAPGGTPAAYFASLGWAAQGIQVPNANTVWTATGSTTPA